MKNDKRIVKINKEEIKEKILEGFTQVQLSEYFECSIATIKRRKREFGLIGLKTNGKPLSDLEIEKIKQLTKKGLILKDIAKSVNRVPETLRKYLTKEMHTNILKNTKVYKSNINMIGSFDNIFKPSRYSAYITGYLQADGCITKDGEVSAISTDIELIYLCARFFNANIHSSIREKNTYYTFSVYDFKKIEKFKEVTGLVHNKTYIPYKIPNWILNSIEYMQCFIVGVFNGDGWAHVLKDRNGIVELGIIQHTSQLEYLKVLRET